MTTIIELSSKDLIWPFHDQQPHVLIGGGNYPRQTKIDPFPCYPHDKVLVRAVASMLEKSCPVPFPVQWYILHYEELGRTNGWEQEDVLEYAKEGKSAKMTASIVLVGKRIPVHPAMTRYTVGHEYGHLLENAISQQRGLDSNKREILTEYRKVRGFDEYPTSYGGGSWHLNIGEIMANDFRVLIAGLEEEFWPHAGVPRPKELPHLNDWWLEAIKQVRELVEQSSPEPVSMAEP